MRYPNIVYDIPTAYYFKWQLGRTGVSGVFKSSNNYINKIAQALGALEPHRASYSMSAIGLMRKVRKLCYEVEMGIRLGLTEAELERIYDLKIIMTKTIDDIMAHKLGSNKVREINKLDHRTLAYQADNNLLPANVGRVLDKGYHLERANSQHFDSGTTKDWLESNTQLGLNDWVHTVGKWQKRDELGGHRAPSGVRYLSALERQRFAVNFRGGRAYDALSNIFHTGNLVSSHSGRGWAIYVLGLDGQFYCSEHIVDKFHHSSFFAGGPVLAGGEIAVDQGVVVGLTNKTGHYKARPEELNLVLQHLTLRLVDVSNIAVQDPFRAPNRWYTGFDALNARGDLSTLGASTAVKPQVL